MKRKMKFLVLALLMLSAVSANAQVTIGSDQEPPAYSLLELDAGSYKGGLHLPRLTTEERDALSLDTGAAGLLIFNISTSCLDIWTGSTWKSQCESTLPEGVNPSSFSFEENGRYALYGKILFDVNGGNVSDYPEPYKNYPSDYPHTCDLSSKLSYDYTLKSSPENSYTFSSAQFVVDDPTGLLDSYSTTTDATVTLTFKSLADVKTLVGNAGRANAKKITIKALFLDNKGEQKKAELVVRVQNAPIGCSVRKVADPTVTPTPTVNGWLTFMCYNLGANPDYGDPAIQKSYVPSPNTGSSTDRTVYGDLYQWGRVDDGHQRRDLTPENIWPADNLGSTTGFTEDPVPNDAANITTGQVLETDARFGKFIRRNTTNYDWIAGGATDYLYNNRWDTTGTKLSKAPADPCPTGWRVPTHTEWASIYGTTVNCSGTDCYTDAKVNKWLHNFEIPPAGDTGTHGVSLTPSTAQGNTTYGTYPTLFLPAGDDRNRDHATIDNSGTYSIYWSSAVVSGSISAYYLSCGSALVGPSHTNHRSYGHSVRCVAE